MNAPTAVDTRRSRADFFFVYIAYALRYLYLLLLIPFFGRVLGVEGYGVVLAAMSLMTIAWRVVEWGFSPVGMRDIATASPRQYAGLFGAQASGRLLLSGLAVVGGGVAIAASPVLSAHPLTGIAAVALGIVSAFNLGWYFIGSHRPRSAVKLEVLGFAVSLVLIFALVRGQGDAHVVMLSLLCSAIIALAVAHWWVRGEIRPLALTIKSGAGLIRSSSTIFLFTGSSALLVASSTYLLGLLAGPAEVGAFGGAERLVAVGLSVMAPAGQIFLPRVTALFVNDERAAYALVRKAMLLLLGIGLAGLLCSVLLGGWIVPLIFGPGFEGSVPILQCMALLFPINAITLILSSYVLIPLHQERLLAKVVLTSALISLLCAVPLGLEYGGIGMAIARIGGETLVLLSLTVACWKMGILTRLFNLHSKGHTK
jgi:O-antigen/teichoic acid export membrane protein